MAGPKPHGLLLTGGTSRRMGADKAALCVGGVPMGVRAGSALLAVAEPVLAVGPDPGLGIASVPDDRRGPLAALVAGMRHLRQTGGYTGPVLLVACDLPFVTPALLALTADKLEGWDASLTVAEGRVQPLAGCYSPRCLPVAEKLVESGNLSLRALLERIDAGLIPPAEWLQVAGPNSLTDVDTPGELAAANRKVRP